MARPRAARPTAHTRNFKFKALTLEASFSGHFGAGSGLLPPFTLSSS